MPGEEQPAAVARTKFPHLKRWLLFGGLALALVLLVVAGAGYLTLYRPVHLANAEIVVIGPSASFGYVANRLQERKLIPNALALKIFARLTNQAGKLKVGEYEVTDGMRPVDILALLVSGHARVFPVTIPEGKWASEIDDILAVHWPEAARDFPALVQQPERWRQQYPFLVGDSLEGYLFPDTYRFPAGASAEDIIDKMLERFQITCYEAYGAKERRDRRSLYDVLILASLVEAEARVDEERTVIAGVYMNRLKTRGWTLDCDATLIYAKQQRVRRVLNQDKLIDSPYNSYKRRGLPPGPINNPGLKSFLAAVHPDDVDYFFYVAQGDGTHVFSHTLAEQSAQIRRIRGNE